MTATTARPELIEAQQFLSYSPAARQISIAQLIRRSFRIAVLFVAARLLGVESFGTYALMLTVVEMSAVISGAGYVDFLTREIAKQPDAGWPLGSKVTLLRFAYIVPVAGVAVVLLKVLRFPSSLILNTALLAVVLIPRAVGESAQGVLKGLRRFAPLPWIEFVQGGILLAVAPALIIYGFGLRGVVFAEILAATGGAVASVFSIAKFLNFQSTESRRLRSLVRSTFAFNIYPFIGNVYDRVDVILLSKLAGNFATGIYSLPYRIFGTLQIIPSSIMGALLPEFSASTVNQEARENCSLAMEFLYIAALLVVLVTLAFAKPVILLLLGQSYTGSILTIKLLAWACVPAFFSYALNTLLLAAHKEKVFVWTATVCTVFNISANLLLIPKFSFVAAAVVTVLTEVLLLAQNSYLVTKHLGHRVFPKNGLKITWIFTLVLAGFLILQRWFSEAFAGSLACAAFIALAVWMKSGGSNFRRWLPIGT